MHIKGDHIRNRSLIEKIYIFFLLFLIVSCSKPSSTIKYRLPETNIPYLMDSLSDKESVIHYLKDHSLADRGSISDTIWSNGGETFTPIFIRGLPGSISIEEYYYKKDSLIHYDGTWTPDSSSILLASDSIAQTNWPVEDIRTWSRQAIYDTLMDRFIPRAKRPVSVHGIVYPNMITIGKNEPLILGRDSQICLNFWWTRQRP